ncbi:MAG: N-6 DNA methylase [Deltaproteobacteria bacterium]|nr:N-6 DNA methylase [Candidatus Zymogenaceae bacterium]
MSRRRIAANGQPLTTAQQLNNLIKSARDIMRKDKGLNGDLDRLPMLTWIMFLKFLDDMEQSGEKESELSAERFHPAIEPPYRWRDWAAQEDGVTGDELLKFINQDEAILPNGMKGAGLLAYLRGLQSTTGRDRRDVIANVFRGVQNRMINGYLLRDVINKVNAIHFNSSEEIHTLGHLYESMLREMRDAAGDSGEFYTPRPIVKFMVTVIDPQLGETVLDPACGTGGFLCEAYQHLSEQCRTVEDRRILQERSIFGQEAKPLPYMLSQMNLLLHGLEFPHIVYDNSLNVRIQEIGDRDRVDVILTNPPFGGEEERGILSNFPEDKQTSETALLFLQLIMRRLKRGLKPGRAAVVVPDGILTQEGVASRVRAMLVDGFRIHTVVRLPRGVFEPYTRSSISILFFDTNPPEEYVWYYEVPLRPGIKAYTQHRPFTYEECDDMLLWWTKRKETERAWQVPKADIAAHDYSLNFRNPNIPNNSRFPSPSKVSTSLVGILDKLKRIADSHTALWRQLESNNNKAYERPPLGELLRQVKREEILKPDMEYAVLAMSWYAKGMYVKHRKLGREIKAIRLYRIEPGDFVYNRLFAWKGSFAEAGEEQAGCYVSNEFPTFQIVDSRVRAGYLWAYFSQPALWDHIEGLGTGTTSTSRLRLKEARFLSLAVPIAPEDIQNDLIKLLRDSLELEREIKKLAETQGQFLPAVLERSLPLEFD